MPLDIVGETSHTPVCTHSDCHDHLAKLHVLAQHHFGNTYASKMCQVSQKQIFEIAHVHGHVY